MQNKDMRQARSVGLRDPRIESLKAAELQEKAFVLKTREINQALSLIEESNKAKEMLNLALKSAQKAKIV